MLRFRNSNYLITEDGRVWSEYSQKYLRASTPDRYSHVVLMFNGRKTFNVHRLVAEVYLDNPLNLPVVNHKDGNKLNNHYTNLEWCTIQHNTTHAYETGLAKGQLGKVGLQGITNPKVKLTESEVLEIRRIFNLHSIDVLMKKFNVSESTIRSIYNRQTWKHI